jgi:sensor histidine kinase regulating citrate/malate metabolism
VLHAVREGLLLLDRDGRLRLINDEGRRLLQVPDSAIGRSVRELALPPDVLSALMEDGERVDDVRLSDDRVLVVSRMPARWRGRELGSVVTLRDHTDLLALTGELDSVRGFAESLRSQAHEAANRLHTVISLIELGHTEKALAFATAELREAQSLTDRLIGAVHEPVLAALLLGKAAEANERGVDLVLAEDLEIPEAGISGRDLVTIVGNLLDNAIDAAVSGSGPRSVTFEARPEPGSGLLLRVTDSGPGIAPADIAHVFDRGWSTKPGRSGAGRGLGLALVRQSVDRHGGTITIEEGNGGAAFVVHLPVPPSTPWPGPPSEPRSDRSPLPAAVTP